MTDTRSQSPSGSIPTSGMSTARGALSVSISTVGPRGWEAVLA